METLIWIISFSFIIPEHAKIKRTMLRIKDRYKYVPNWSHLLMGAAGSTVRRIIFPTNRLYGSRVLRHDWALLMQASAKLVALTNSASIVLPESLPEDSAQNLMNTLSQFENTFWGQEFIEVSQYSLLMLDGFFTPEQTAALGAFIFTLRRFRSELIQMQNHIVLAKYHIQDLRPVCRCAAAVPVQLTQCGFLRDAPWCQCTKNDSR